MSFIDFKDIKARVTIEDAAKWLGLKMVQHGEALRSQCPQSKGDPRELVISPRKQVFNCFGCKGGSGDVIALVAHCKFLPMREAARELHAAFIGEAKPEKAEAKVDTLFDPQKVLDRLNYGHEALDPFIVDEDVRRLLGIGVDTRGYLKGLIAIPLRLPDGTISGFVGVPLGTALKFPKTLKLE